MGGMTAIKVPGHQSFHIFLQQLFPAVSEQGFRLSVYQDYPAFAVRCHQGVRNGFEEKRQALFGSREDVDVGGTHVRRSVSLEGSAFGSHHILCLADIGVVFGKTRVAPEVILRTGEARDTL